MNATEKKRIALLCDYGLDDAIATLYIFEHAHLFEQIDILPIAGNFSLEKAMINAKRLLTHCENPPKGIRLVDTSPINQPADDLPFIHGADGMGDVMPKEYEQTVPVISYGEWLSQVDDRYLILSLGPCTVTEDILEKKGALPLVLMCGNIAQPPNQGDYEFNHAINRPAFARCVSYPHFSATLDTCHCPPCDLTHVDLSKDGLLYGLMRAYRRLSMERKEENCYVYDLTAAVYTVYPQRFECYNATDRDGNLITVLKYVSSKTILE